MSEQAKSFSEWMEDVNEAAIERGYQCVVTPDDLWEMFYKDGLSPKDALDESERHA